jgi:asparagine synthase (glutamine-hydrolysing)
MCGLAVSISFDGRPADIGALGRMADAIAHRGPDDVGFATYGPVGFAFRRLAILDLSPAGHQPMESVDGRYTIVFNGEIYNYIELKAELQTFGYEFRTASDTEVLLTAYRHWGRDCVTRFNGMWAFVVYDAVRKSLFASRDRFGVKPLYRFRRANTLILASEVKAIVASGLYDPRADWRSVSNFLVRGRLDDDTRSFYDSVDQLAAGSTLEIEADGRCTERRFWSLKEARFNPPGSTDSDDRPDAVFRSLLEDAVRLRMRSDVPVGVCLSGGIDSNAIISFMADLWPSGTPLRMQAFSYIPKEFGEAEYIHQSIEKTRAQLNEVQLTPQSLWDVLPTALWHYDAPVHSASALIGFELMRLARSRGVKVVLNGQGSDEVNAGYPLYFENYWTDLVLQGQPMTAWREISAHSASHQSDRRAVARKVAGVALRRTLERLPGYLARAARRRATRLHADPWVTPELTKYLETSDVSDPSMSLEAALEYSVERRPLPLYLRVEDRNSMAHSVEARLPFLDYRLVSYAHHLPANWKLRGPWNKHIVREATKGVIAEGVRTRLDKMGFPQPSRDWLAGPWFGPAHDVLSSRTVRDSGLVNVPHALKALERHRAGELDATRQTFRLIQFGIWLDSCLKPGAGQGRGLPQAAAPVGELR